MEKLFSSTNKLLKKRMDELVENFVDASPEFYRKYFDSRMVIDLGRRTTSLIGSVKNNAAEIEGAKVELIIRADEPTEIIKTTETDKHGEFSFEKIPSGEHTLRVTKTGFNKEEIEDLKVEKGRVNEVEVGIKEE